VTTVGGIAQQLGTTNGVGTVARFNSSFGVASGQLGELYVVEWVGGHVVRKGTPMGFKPLVSLEAATVANTVTLHGTVNANGFVTSARFEYGNTQTLGNEVALSLGANAATSEQAVTAQLSSLDPGTTYYYRLTASNVDGSAFSKLGSLTTLSTNADLSALALSSGSLSPSFGSGTTAYTATVSGANSSITMTPSVAQANASIVARVNGGAYIAILSGSASSALALNVGANTVDVRVTAQDGVTQKTYTVTVTRANPIQNLVVAQRAGTRLVDLSYDLNVAAPVKITVEISSDGGQTYFVPAYALTGDVGLNMISGNGKKITWDAGADWPGNLSDQMRFRIVADDLSDGFSYIPEGPFTMGRTSGDTDSDAPPTLVKVSRFELQTTETSKAQWDVVRAWAVNNGYTDLAVGAGKAANHPVQTVSWWDVVKWCNARSEMEGLVPVYTAGGQVMRTGVALFDVNWNANGYQLPTEAEWEKAARGGVRGKRFPWGDQVSQSDANYYGGTGTMPYHNGNSGFHPQFFNGTFPGTAPIASFQANGYGLFDVCGNVMEWCFDWRDSLYYVENSIDPSGPASGTLKSLRGGYWDSYADHIRLAYRGGRDPLMVNGSIFIPTGIGFRPVKNLEPLDGIATSDPIQLDSRYSQAITFAAIPDKLTTASVNLAATGGGSNIPVRCTFWAAR